MPDKAWKHIIQVSRHPRTFLLGFQLEYYRWTPGWPSINLFLSLWHRTYSLWLYKMGED